MKYKALWKISILTTREADEAVAEALGTILNRAVSTYFNVKTRRSTVSAFRETRPAPGVRKNISIALQRIRDCGLKTGPGRVTVAKLRREDWAESWKHHFKPIEIGNSLLIKPGWSKRQPRKGQAVVVLDPGLGFGTGQHPTTAFCLHELARCGKFRPNRSFLDIGTGSGILAIAAAKLGYSPVHAFDCDADAVRFARANARANRVHKKVRITRRDLATLRIPAGKRYDLICANLISPLLLAERRRIVAQLQRGGTIVLAGILKTEFSRIESAYAELGLKLAAARTGNEWRSGTFCYARENSAANFE